jgi:hypothetical protein
LRDNELFAGPKGEDDVRPIAIGNTYRKLAAMAIMRVAQEDFNERYFGNLQFAMKKNGIEEIIHTFALSLEMNPELSIMNVDGMNAFNMTNGFAGLGTILEEFPQLSLIYGECISRISIAHGITVWTRGFRSFQ